MILRPRMAKSNGETSRFHSLTVERAIIRKGRNIEVPAMKSSWRSETGYLALRWTEVGQRDQSPPSWMKECSEAQGGHIPPLPDFLDHSPFGGVSWFQPDPAGRNQAIFR